MIKGIITECTQSVAKTGSPYCTLRIKSKVSDHIVNVWGAKSSKLPLWQEITINNEKVNDQGVSCTMANVSISKADATEWEDVIPKIVSANEWEALTKELELIIMHDRCCNSPKEEDFFVKCMKKMFNLYSTKPAAKHNHHAYKGGLLVHTYQLLNMFRALYKQLPFKVKPFIVCISCLFHDFYKMSEYEDESFDYTKNMFLKGHVVGSAEVLGNLMREQEFDSDLILHCQHCILAHHGKLEWGSPVVPSTPEAFLVHHLDMLSGHGTMFEETPNNTKSFGLGTTIFHYGS